MIIKFYKSRDANPNLLTFSEYKENVSGCTLPM